MFTILEQEKMNGATRLDNTMWEHLFWKFLMWLINTLCFRSYHCEFGKIQRFTLSDCLFDFQERFEERAIHRTNNLRENGNKSNVRLFFIECQSSSNYTFQCKAHLNAIVPIIICSSIITTILLMCNWGRFLLLLMPMCLFYLMQLLLWSVTSNWLSFHVLNVVVLLISALFWILHSIKHVTNAYIAGLWI